jgi:hypothetical protein
MTGSIRRPRAAVAAALTGLAAVAQAVTFDVTQAVQDAADAGLPELTFALRAPNEAAVAQWHRFNKTVHLDVETAAVPADPAS